MILMLKPVTDQHQLWFLGLCVTAGLTGICICQSTMTITEAHTLLNSGVQCAEWTQNNLNFNVGCAQCIHKKLSLWHMAQFHMELIRSVPCEEVIPQEDCTKTLEPVVKTLREKHSGKACEYIKKYHPSYPWIFLLFYNHLREFLHYLIVKISVPFMQMSRHWERSKLQTVQNCMKWIQLQVVGIICSFIYNRYFYLGMKYKGL